MQSVSSRIWTRVAVSISYDDNHYTTGTSNFIFNDCRPTRKQIFLITSLKISLFCVFSF